MLILLCWSSADLKMYLFFSKRGSLFDVEPPGVTTLPGADIPGMFLACKLIFQLTP